MSDATTTVEWIAEERTVPYLGHFEKGKQYPLPTAQAQQFIDNGNARHVKQRARTTTTE